MASSFARGRPLVALLALGLAACASSPRGGPSDDPAEAAPVLLHEPDGPLPPRAEPSGSCVVGVPEAPSIASGAGAALVWQHAFTDSFAPLAVAASPSGVSIVGVLKASFGGIAAPANEWKSAVATFDAAGKLEHVRELASRLESERELRVVDDGEGTVAASSEAGPVGGRGRVVIAAWDRAGNERYRRVIAGPRAVHLDALVVSPVGGVVVATHFDEGVDGVTVPAFTPQRVRNVLLTRLDARGQVARTKVLPVGQVVALGTSSGALSIVMRTEGPAEVGGVVVRWENDRVTVPVLVGTLDATTLEPRSMAPANGEDDPARKRTPDGSILPPGTIAVPSATTPWLLTTRATGGPREGTALEVRRGGRTAGAFAMNVALLDASAMGADRVALLVAPLPPKLHPHCAGGPGASPTLVVLRP